MSKELRSRNKVVTRSVPAKAPGASTAAVTRLVHELQVYQVELEMQNEELRRTHVELELSRDDYAELYDFAPSGYLSLDPGGFINEANLAATALLGVERMHLLGRAFSDFVPGGKQAEWVHYLTRVTGGEKVQTAEMMLRRSDGTSFHAHLESRSRPAAGETGRRCMVSLTDVTERRKAQEERRKALDALLRSEERFRLALQVCPTGVIMVDAYGMLCMANPEFERLSGYGEQELLGQSVDLLLPDHLRERHAGPGREYDGARSTGCLGPARQLALRRRDGTVLPVEVSLSNEFPLAEGTCRLAVVTDVSKRRGAERDAGFLLDLHPFLMSERDTSTMIRGVLQAVGKHLHVGYAAYGDFTAGGASLTLHEEWIDQREGLLGEHRLTEYLSEEALAALVAGASLVVDDVALDPRTRAQADNFSRLRVRAFAVEPLVIADGPKALIGIAADVPRAWQPEECQLLHNLSARLFPAVERARAEDALRQLNRDLEQRVRERTAELTASEAKYRHLVENTRDIAFSMDAGGRVTFIGPQATQYGFDAADVVGRSFLDFILPADRARASDNLRRTVADGRSYPLEFRVEAPGGGAAWFEALSTLEFDAAGALTDIIGLLRDITERKNAESLRAHYELKLRQLAARLASAQDDEQRRIAQGLHDDVAQILTACSLQFGVAEGTRKAAERRRVYDHIETMIRDANEKIHLLSFELVSSALRRLGLTEALVELCDSMSARFGVNFVVDGDLGPDVLDETASTVVFKAARELLFNVVKHAGIKEAKVSIGCVRELVTLTVEDRGTGFPLGTAAGDGIGGNGLGLFGIRERMHDLGGQLRIESTAGVSTRVTLQVPVRKKLAKATRRRGRS